MKRNYSTMSQSEDFGQKCGKGNKGLATHNYLWSDFRDKPAAWNPRSMSYLCYAPEICPTTGKPHWQSYMHLKHAKNVADAMRLIKHKDEKMWIIQANGTPEQNRIYCKGPYDDGDGKVKPENPNFVEFGELPAQGQRNDIRSITADIADGANNADIIMRHGDNALRMYRAIDWARQALNTVKRDWKMDVRIYWGPTGCSKTWTAMHEFGIEDTHKQKASKKWWHGYAGQHCVVIDEFKPKSAMDIDYWLDLMDEYPTTVEAKGTEMEFVSKVLIFTSNINPHEWWTTDPQEPAFFRRVGEIRYFDVPYKTDKGGAVPPHSPP